MNRALKLILALGVVAMVVALAMPAHAQCATSNAFGATGSKGVAGRVFIATAANGFPSDGNESGSFWERGAANNNNGGPHFAGPETCGCTAGNTWCQTQGVADMSVNGLLSSPTCVMGPAGYCEVGKTLVWVIEDTSNDDSDAGFISYQVDYSTTTVRPFDHSRTANPAPQAITTHTMESFPTVDVQSSSGPPPNTTLENNYANVVINFHGVTGGGANTPVDSPVNAGGAIQAYDVCTFRGAADPGRDRSLWTCDGADQVPYTQSAADLTDSFAVPCPDGDLDTFVAVGIEFVDGIKSVNVGRSTAVECNPTIADPDQVKPRRQDRLGSRGRMGR